MSVQSEQRWKRRGQRENNKQAALSGMLEGFGLARSPRTSAAAAMPRNHTRAYVRQWMTAHAAEYDGCTALAEGANAALRLPADCLDDETHWIWDEALRAIEREGGEA